MTWGRSLALLCWFAPACTGADARDDAGEAEVGVVDADVDAGEVRVEVGTGAFAFEPLELGQMVEFTAGPQGGGRYDGFHIWMGARAWGVDPIGILVTFLVLDAADRVELARLEWKTNFRAAPDGADEIWGGTPRLQDCCRATARPLLLRVEVQDCEGVTAAGEVDVRGAPQCGADLCP